MARQALMVRVIMSMKAAGTATMHTFPTDLVAKNHDKDEDKEEKDNDGITDLVPATMKTKVVRVAMPSTKRIWFLSPPNSPRLESSLTRMSLFVVTSVLPFPHM